MVEVEFTSIIFSDLHEIKERSKRSQLETKNMYHKVEQNIQDYDYLQKYKKKKTHVHAMENKINHLCTDKMLCFKNGKHNSWKLCLCLHTKLSV